MTKKNKSNLSPKGRKKNEMGIILVLLLGIFIGIIGQYFYIKQDNLLIGNVTYYKGNIYSANHAANMLDYLDKGNNIIISPINVNSSLAILYNGTDNKSSKELRKYFKKTQNEVNSEMNYKLSTLKAENKTKTKINHHYEEYIKELSRNSYNTLTISTISLLSKEQKEELILLLRKIELSYEKINNQNNLSEKNIKDYKLTTNDLSLNNYQIKELLDKIISNYESYSVVNEVNNHTKIYINNVDGISKEFSENTSLYNYDIKSINQDNENDKVRTISENISNESNGLNRILEDTEVEQSDIIVTNNLHFNYNWNIPFDQNSIKDTEFYNIDNEIQAVEMMYANQTTYLENTKAKGFKYDFENGKYSFVGILPKSDEDFKLSTINIDSFLLSKKEGKVLIGIPKMNYQSEIDIEELANHYNINEIFTDKANFTRISEEKLKINKMIQKNNLTIAEKGTKKSNLKQHSLYNLDDDYKEQIVLNRPYAYLIINNETNDILFIGKVVRINEGS